MADFRDVVSVLPCSPTNKGKRNLCGCSEKGNRQWAFVAFWLSSHVQPATLKQRLRLQIDWHQKTAQLFSLIYFFGSFYVYYFLHNYVIPQAMPHAIPQTHSSFYPHRFFTTKKTENPKKGSSTMTTACPRAPRGKKTTSWSSRRSQEEK